MSTFIENRNVMPDTYQVPNGLTGISGEDAKSSTIQRLITNKCTNTQQSKIVRWKDKNQSYTTEEEA